MKLLLSKDYSAFDEGFNGSGVYLIQGLKPSQTFERAIYIGSSRNLLRRIRYGHLTPLRNNRHTNKPLQHYYNKHGIDALEVYLIELVEPERLIEREQHYLDLEQPFADLMRGFNLARDAQAPSKGTSRKHTEAAKQRMSIVQKGRMVSSDARARISASRIAERNWNYGKPMNPNTARAIIKSRVKIYTFRKPSGELIEIENLSAFSRANGLCQSSMCAVASGKQPHHKQWRAV